MKVCEVFSRTFMSGSTETSGDPSPELMIARNSRKINRTAQMSTTGLVHVLMNQKGPVLRRKVRTQ